MSPIGTFTEMPSVGITPAQEYIAIQLLTRTLKATYKQTKINLTSQPLCLIALAIGMTMIPALSVEGKLPMQSPGRFEEFTNDYPDFINAVVSWTLSHSSDVDVHEIVPDLVSCECDHSDPMIAMLHGIGQSSGDTSQTYLKHMGTRSFRVIFGLLGESEFHQLSRVNERDSEKLKRKRRAYEVFSHYIVDDPSSLVWSATSWYKTTGCPAAMKVLSDYIALQTPMFEQSLMGLDPELPVLILKRMVDIMSISQASGTSSKDLFDESMRTLCIIMSLSSATLLSALCVENVLGHHAKTIYSLLQWIIAMPDAQVRSLDSGRFFPSPAFPSFGVAAMNVHRVFCRTHALGALNPAQSMN